MMQIEVLEIKDLPDGGAILVFDIDQNSLVEFAKIGLLKVLTEAAENEMIKSKNTEAAIEENSDEG